jgi:signal transduction histidine kinase
MSRSSVVRSRRGFRPWQAARDWLSDVPVHDPVDRRNAPMLQVVLLMLGLLPPLAWAYRILVASVPWRPGETVGLLLSLALSALALFSAWLIRRGRLQWAVRQLLVVVALVMMLSYLSTGFGANRFEQPIQVIWLVIAGLVIGRRALWLMYGWTVLAFAAGTLHDVGPAADVADELLNIGGDAVISAIIFLFLAVVLDRSTTAFRESLAAANRHGSELAQVNMQLREEMAERERVQHQLVHAQKVEAVGRLAGGVAHDFNHLLGLILGYVDRGRQAHSDGERDSALAGVEAAARRATAISRKLLNFSRHDITRLETFDAGAALRGVQPLLRQLFAPGVELVLDVPGAALPVYFDRAQLELVTLNLAANAAHAMGDKGRFTVSLADAGDGRHVDLQLCDTGHGIDEEIRGRIFEPFFTTKPAGQGTGLGLAITRDLVTAAGGTITVESRPGTGTVFHIHLLRDAPAAADVAASN